MSGLRLRKSKSIYVPGFKAGGIACGIKSQGGKDLVLILSDPPATAAGVFTRNQVRAPSVIHAEQALENHKTFRAILVNSGNANACTGPQGQKDCKLLIGQTAGALGIREDEILTASTGVIGVPLPTDNIVRGLTPLVQHISSRNWEHAAEGILTTDLVPKLKAVEYSSGDKKIVIGGIAKGSGMIAPNMATMLGFMVTNAVIGQKALKRALKSAVDATFNRITVDGENSTNDMVLMLANGKTGNKSLSIGSPGYEDFVEALTVVCRDLAYKIVLDGEGATKFVTVSVVGARSTSEAEILGRRVANSLLVKTALYGADPNWGRILAALGDAGVPIKPDKVDIAFNKMTMVKGGAALPGASRAQLRKKMKSREVEIHIDLNLGKASAQTFTCDLSYDYIKINAEYTT